MGDGHSDVPAEAEGMHVDVGNTHVPCVRNEGQSGFRQDPECGGLARREGEPISRPAASASRNRKLRTYRAKGTCPCEHGTALLCGLTRFDLHLPNNDSVGRAFEQAGRANSLANSSVPLVVDRNRCSSKGPS